MQALQDVALNLFIPILTLIFTIPVHDLILRLLLRWCRHLHHLLLLLLHQELILLLFQSVDIVLLLQE